MSDSKLPVPSSRLVHDSPPVKNRKALNELTEMINSPKYSMKDPSHQQSSIPVPKLEVQKTRRTHRSGIPTPQPIHVPAQIKERLRSLSDAHSSMKLRDTKPRMGRFSLAGQDPSAIKRDSLMEERIIKLIEVETDKIHELDKKIKETKRLNEEYGKARTLLMRDISNFKSEVINAEVGIVNMEDKMQNSIDNLAKEKLHNEQLYTLKLREVQNQMVRELDEFKAMMEQELASVRNYNDAEAQSEIATLEAEQSETTNEVDQLRKAHQEKLKAESELKEKELELVVQSEEAKGEELTKEYALNMELLSQLQDEFDSTQSDIDAISHEISRLDVELSNSKLSQSSVKEETDKLMQQISSLRKESTELDKTVTQITMETNETNGIFEESLNKLKRERHFRRRIENSIEDLTGMHRVYLRVPDDSNTTDCDGDTSLQELHANDTTYVFSRIFKASDELISEETCSLVESALNGCNVSFILTGDDCTMASSIMGQCHIMLHEREPKLRGWKFNYQVQTVNITPNGVFDMNSEKSCEIKVENRAIVSTSDVCEYTSGFKLNTPADSSLLVKISIDARSDARSFTSSVYILDLSHIDSLPLLQQAIAKIGQGKCGTKEFDHPMYQLVHQLYANTKIVTMLQLDELDAQWLELGRMIQNVKVVPVKRVYSVMM